MMKVLLLLSLLVLLSRGATLTKVIVNSVDPYGNDAINAGDTVIWINNSTAPHTVDSINQKFNNSGNIPVSSNFSLTLTQPGVYPYNCSYHVLMVGVLTVCNPANETVQGNACVSCLLCNGTCCGNGFVCVNNVCQASVNCSAGLTKCRNTCVNTTSDTLNCGSCNSTCAVGSVCVNSACAGSSALPQNFPAGPNNSTTSVSANIDIQAGQDYFFKAILPAVNASALASPNTNVQFSITVGGLGASDMLTLYVSQVGTSASAARTSSIAPANPFILTAASNTVSVHSTTASEFFILFRLSTIARKRHIEATLATLTFSVSQQLVTICPSPQSLCGSACLNLATDSNNCGACGNQCDTGLVCNTGSCSTVCAPPLTNCNGFCINLATDYLHCSSCSKICPIGQLCSSSACIPDPVYPERFRALIGATVVEGPAYSTASVSGIFLPHGTEKFYSAILSPVNPALLANPRKLVKFTFRISGLVSTDSVTIYISQNGTFKAFTLAQAIAPANPAILTQANNEVSVTSRNPAEFVVLFRLMSSTGLKRSIRGSSHTDSSTVTLQAFQQIIDQPSADVYSITLDMANLLPITN